MQNSGDHRRAFEALSEAAQAVLASLEKEDLAHAGALKAIINDYIVCAQLIGIKPDQKLLDRIQSVWMWLITRPEEIIL